MRLLSAGLLQIFSISLQPEKSQQGPMDIPAGFSFFAIH